ncbi:uncharacterized protein MYCFIDRAFT_200473 [Pseudocercospora fijiensis CIRAD86]|uniref:BTB domain-containing protein n=1 Tax=Pseudocercospora fijiensis (strain CIRAD86) TaxID=383855 RepID=M2YK74_PSEFD|nr:uncharacterized protein MYCFIDRAFT_200473 [Pseudocercospora fijiensis CIRAD86]EME78160.1 hypothetical protein MYCFIDRAFT_200473 [Pseudocercospora fijiensis CIRAD86]
MANVSSIRRPYSSLEDATEELVKVTVSYDATTAHHFVKRKLLCETSKWFKQELGDEAVSHVRIHKCVGTYECVKHYIHWLNTGTLASEDTQVPVWDERIEDKEYELLTLLWYFGKKYGISGFQDAAISAMLARMESSKAAGELILVGKNCINFAYHPDADPSRDLKPPSKLHEIFVEMYATQDSSSHLEKIQEGLSPTFLADLCKRQNAQLHARSLRSASKRLAEDNACDFHQHGSEEVCYAGGPAAKRQRKDHAANEPCERAMIRSRTGVVWAEILQASDFQKVQERKVLLARSASRVACMGPETLTQDIVFVYVKTPSTPQYQWPHWKRFTVLRSTVTKSDSPIFRSWPSFRDWCIISARPECFAPWIQWLERGVITPEALHTQSDIWPHEKEELPVYVHLAKWYA